MSILSFLMLGIISLLSTKAYKLETEASDGPFLDNRVRGSGDWIWKDDYAYPFIRLPREGFQGRIYIAYTRDFLETHGNETDEFVDSVFSHLQRFYLDESLGATINLTLGGKGLWDIPVSLGEMGKVIMNGTIDPDMDHYSLLNPTKTRVFGLGYIGEVCNYQDHRVSLVLTSRKNDVLNARVVAHELGHSLSFGHDYEREDCERRRIMSNGHFATKWSNCTRKDFYKYWNKAGGHWGGFCLHPGKCRCYDKGSVSLECVDDQNTCECKPGYTGPKCDMCWPLTLWNNITAGPECSCFLANAEISVRSIKKPHKANSTSACHEDCINDPDCDYFVHRQESGYCLLKGLKAYKKTGLRGMIAGRKFCKGNANNCFESNTDYPHLRIVLNGGRNRQLSKELCRKSCVSHAYCEVFGWNSLTNKCVLRGFMLSTIKKRGSVSGHRNCPKKNLEIIEAWLNQQKK